MCHLTQIKETKQASEHVGELGSKDKHKCLLPIAVGLIARQTLESV